MTAVAVTVTRTLDLDDPLVLMESAAAKVIRQAITPKTMEKVSEIWKEKEIYKDS